jgi:hypothetical protein
MSLSLEPGLSSAKPGTLFMDGKADPDFATLNPGYALCPTKRGHRDIGEQSAVLSNGFAR